jgi:hypothetical protein
MDAHKVELLVRITRVHNDAPVLTIPNDQLAVPLGVLRRHGIIQRNLAWDQEPECALAGGLCGDVSSLNLGASLGLQSGVLVCQDNEMKIQSRLVSILSHG